MSKKHLYEKIRRTALERDRYLMLYCNEQFENNDLRREILSLQKKLEKLTKSSKD